MSLTGPRLLIEPSDYVLRNVGDMAMLCTAAGRLQALLPNALVQVLTDHPEALQSFCPSAAPFPARGRHLWLGRDELRDLLRRTLPDRFADMVRDRLPERLSEAAQRRLSRNEDPRRLKDEFVRAVKECDLLVVAGMGGITDAFADYAAGVLGTIELAVSFSRPVAMTGQGFGPLDNPRLRARAAAILPKLDLIALREKKAGIPLLLSLGVDPARLIVTGDDAVEMAYNLRTGALGSGIGLNLRLSDYSAVGADTAADIGKAVSELARARSSPLIPVPISSVPGEADLDVLRTIMPDSEPELAAAASLSSPEDVIRQVQRCRLVVTGSYHAGVFALANGIPTIGIAASPYYRDKFHGLADMFGEGCEVVNLRDPDALGRLRESGGRLWRLADQLRGRLLKAAEAQVRASEAAYRKVAELAVERVETRR